MEWRPIPGFEHCYEVSDQGHVRRTAGMKDGRGLTPHFLKGDNVKGYPRVSLHWDGKKKRMTVHRIVMLAFAGDVPPGKEVNHRNGDRSDPRFENLEYVTKRENALHKCRVLKRHHQKGEAHGRHKITEVTVRAIRSLHLQGMKGAHIARKFKVCDGTVSLIVRRKIWRHI